MKFKDFIKTTEYFIITIGMFLVMVSVLTWSDTITIFILAIVWCAYMLVNVSRWEQWFRSKFENH